MNVFSKQGKEGHKGPHSYSVSGRAKEPGVKLLAGISMNELLNDCGGMLDGHKFLVIYLEDPRGIYLLKWQIYHLISEH